MAYLVLEDLHLKTNYVSREVNILEYNVVLAKIELFVNALKSNIDHLQENGVASAGTESAIASYEVPTDPSVTLWLDLNNSDLTYAGTDYVVEYENTDSLFEVNMLYDDDGNFIGG